MEFKIIMFVLNRFLWALVCLLSCKCVCFHELKISIMHEWKKVVGDGNHCISLLPPPKEMALFCWKDTTLENFFFLCQLIIQHPLFIFPHSIATFHFHVFPNNIETILYPRIWGTITSSIHDLWFFISWQLICY